MTTASTSLPRIGFIGLGIMGASMAGHLLAAGHPLSVSNRSKDKAADLLARGAIWCDTPAEVARRSDVVITIVGYPTDVEQVWRGPQGLIANARHALLIDMTTSSPDLARSLAAEAAAAGHQALDAPVSGGSIGARDAKLSIMVGGEPQAYEAALPVLRHLGPTIARMGGPGAGQHSKMANQLVIASTIMGVCEGLAYARAAGLDAQQLLATIGGGAAGGFQLNVLGPRIAAGDVAAGFFVEHFLKDLGIALSEAQRLGLDLPGATLARKLYEELAGKGHGRLGTQALSLLYQGGQ